MSVEASAVEYQRELWRSHYYECYNLEGGAEDEDKDEDAIDFSRGTQSEEKWKFEKAGQVKKAQYKKEHFLKKNDVNMSPEELVTMQTEIKALGDEFDAYREDWLGAKAEASAQPTKENASTTDENHTVEETKNTRVAEEIPAPEETARETSNVVPEEQLSTVEASAAAPEETGQDRATASVVPEETQPNSSAPPAKSSQMKKVTIPSASEAKKTKATGEGSCEQKKSISDFRVFSP
nr:uncharacterized protein LOC109778439 [Aegilops tauschii subsp. strangulata]